MSVNEVTYYEVSCDEPGCGTETGDLGDYSAWSNRGAALDQWLDADGQYLPDGSTYCESHRKPQCDECEEFVPVDEDRLCTSCRDSDGESA